VTSTADEGWPAFFRIAVIGSRNVIDRTLVHDGSEIFQDNPMHTPNIIERAFQLAGDSNSVEEVRKALRGEGYSNVDAHLGGAGIKADLKKRFARQPD
jgi:hydroxymethylpyrimidine/phosphomethylpyrimidine kinase